MHRAVQEKRRREPLFRRAPKILDKSFLNVGIVSSSRQYQRVSKLALRASRLSGAFEPLVGGRLIPQVFGARAENETQYRLCLGRAAFGAASGPVQSGLEIRSGGGLGAEQNSG